METWNKNFNSENVIFSEIEDDYIKIDAITETNFFLQKIWNWKKNMEIKKTPVDVNGFISFRLSFQTRIDF